MFFFAASFLVHPLFILHISVKNSATKNEALVKPSTPTSTRFTIYKKQITTTFGFPNPFPKTNNGIFPTTGVCPKQDLPTFPAEVKRWIYASSSRSVGVVGPIFVWKPPLYQSQGHVPFGAWKLRDFWDFGLWTFVLWAVLLFLIHIYNYMYIIYICIIFICMYIYISHIYIYIISINI